MKRVLAVVLMSLAGACTSNSDASHERSTSIVSTTTESESVTTTSPPTTTMPVSADCPLIGPERSETDIGPFFACERPSDGNLAYGGQVVHRDGVSTAEEAVVAWLAGPTGEEQAAGLQGWDLRPFPWFAESLTLRREGITLVMKVGQWEPINNLSTSSGSAGFYMSLFGTVFSDPTVEQFELSILGESCPVMIGESEWCFPIDWLDFVGSLGDVMTGRERIALLTEIYERMGVEPCCGEDPGVGPVGVLGFAFGDNQIFVSSGDFDFLAQGLDGADPDVPFHSSDDETVVLFECGDSWYRMENMVAGFVAAVPDGALAAFTDGAGCTVQR